jgi:hypothetical protein
LCAKPESDTSNWFATNANEKETDIYLIREVVGKFVAVGKCYQYGWLLHGNLDSQNRSMKGITIPKSLSEKAQLKMPYGTQIYLINFINSLEEIENVVPDGILKDQIGDVRKFYDDKSVALSMLKKSLEAAQDELSFIYRMRNKIAHDGNSEHFLLPSVCDLAKNYALIFFRSIQNSVERGTGADLKTILIKAVQKYEQIELLLKSEKPVSIFLGPNSGQLQPREE